MPFLGQDWRSPGQSWVKTEEGWKKTSADDKNNNVSVERLVMKHVLTNVAVSITTVCATLKCAISVVDRGRWREEEGGGDVFNKVQTKAG